MTGVLRSAAVLAFGVFTGATCMLFPAALVGFQQFPDDPALAGVLASRQFDGYAWIAWSSLAVGLAAVVTCKARRADRVAWPLGASMVTVACVAAWLGVMRPVIDQAGAERRTAPTAEARADAESRFRIWHGVSMLVALVSLCGGAVATVGSARVRD